MIPFIVKCKHLIYYNYLCVLSTRNILKWLVRLLIGEIQIYKADKYHHRTSFQNSVPFCASQFLFHYVWVLSQNQGPVCAPVSLTGAWCLSLSSKHTEKGLPLSGKLADFSVLKGK